MPFFHTLDIGQILNEFSECYRLCFKAFLNSKAVFSFSVVTTVLFYLSGVFKKWRQRKRKVDAENEKAFRARAILTRNYKARVLQAWRVVNQEQQIISPMVARRERKEMARYNDRFKKVVKRGQNLFCIPQADEQIVLPCLTVSGKSSEENWSFSGRQRPKDNCTFLYALSQVQKVPSSLS